MRSRVRACGDSLISEALMAKKYRALKVVFLGGVGEIGKNMTAIEYGDNILIVDCGCMFGTYDTPGVDLIIPDFSYIDENIDKIKVSSSLTDTKTISAACRILSKTGLKT